MAISTPIEYHDSTSVLSGKASQLNNVLKVPVVLASEMISWYHRSELPKFLTDQVPADWDFIPIFKPFEELEEAISGLQTLPMVINHRKKKLIENDNRIVGPVKGLWADYSDRSIKGWAYFNLAKISQDLANRIKNGAVIDVSVDGITFFGPGGTWMGQEYSFRQRNISLDYLAILPTDKGRCPSSVCGLNKDQSPNLVSSLSTIIHPIVDAVLLSKLTTKAGKMTGVDEKISPHLETVIPKYPLGDKDPSTNSLGVDLMAEPLQKIIDQRNKDLEKKDQEIAALRDSLSKTEVKGFQTQLDENKIAMETLSTVVKAKDSEIEKLKVRVAEADKNDKAAEEKDQADLVDILVSTKLYKAEDLKDKCIKELRIMQDTLVKASTDMSDSNKKLWGFPKPTEAQRQAALTESKTKAIPDCSVNVNEMFKKEETK